MKMNLGVKIGGGFGILLLIAAALGGLAIVNMNKVGTLAEMLDKEYVPEVRVANNVERHSLLTMYAIRGYAFTSDNSMLEEGQKQLAEVKKNLDEAGDLADKSAHLVKLKGAVGTVKDNVNRYEKYLADTIAINNAIEAAQKEMNAAAKDYMDNCDIYLANQNKKMGDEIDKGATKDDLQERLKKILTINDVIDLGNTIRIGVWKAQAERDVKLIDEVLPHFEPMEAKIAEIRAVTIQQANLDQLDKIKAAGKKYQTAMLGLKENMVRLAEAGKQRNEAAQVVLAESEKVSSAGIEQTVNIADTAVNALGTASTVMVVGLILALIIGVVVATFITRAITGPIAKAMEMLNEMGRGVITRRLRMDREDEIGQMAKTMDAFADSLQNEVVSALQMLAKGDLTFEAKPKGDDDAIGNALKKTIDDLNAIVSEINAAAGQIASGSSQVSDSSQALSQGATEQAASLEEITSSMTELSSQTKTNAENANQANQLSGDARNAADSGNQQMQGMVAAMGEINAAGQSISKIIKVIDEIAFQTNLLALNAAVEAARAGRHGKGFAVVAEEVRNLAARSAKAAKETAELIEDSVKKTENGTEIANKTAVALGEIVTAATKVTDLINEIAAASNEQAEGITQVNQGLSQIDQVTQQNTASAEQGASAAEELSSQAEYLRGLVGQFTVKGGPGGGRSMAQRALPHPTQHHPKPAGGGHWSDAAKRPAPKPVGHQQPHEVIALDDKEFGKY